MDNNDNSGNALQEDVVVLGVASVETKGPLIPPVEGMGSLPIGGISAD